MGIPSGHGSIRTHNVSEAAVLGVEDGVDAVVVVDVDPESESFASPQRKQSVLSRATPSTISTMAAAISNNVVTPQ